MRLYSARPLVYAVVDVCTLASFLKEIYLTKLFLFCVDRALPSCCKEVIYFSFLFANKIIHTSSSLTEFVVVLGCIVSSLVLLYCDFYFVVFHNMSSDDLPVYFLLSILFYSFILSSHSLKSVRLISDEMLYLHDYFLLLLCTRYLHDAYLKICDTQTFLLSFDDVSIIRTPLDKHCVLVEIIVSMLR